MDAERLLGRTWRFFRRLFRPWMRHKFNYLPEYCEVGAPHLVLCNHNTDWDPLLIGCAFPEPLHFVASEHIFRKKLTGAILRRLTQPIARLKGTTASDTALTILRTLRRGNNVCIFAEGNRSFNGETCPIPPSTGKLVRAAGVTLVTYRLDGGYFSSPRWSSSLRKGKMTGRVMGIYPPERLKAMSIGEINTLIQTDLYVDAYAEQRREMTEYAGKHLAEHLERIFCICPHCGAVGTLKSKGDTLSCRCGFSAVYDSRGFLSGDAPYDNITDWDKAQTEKLHALADAGGKIFSDTDFHMKEILQDETELDAGDGSMALYEDRLECCGLSFPLKDVGGFALRGPQTVNLSAANRNFEITSRAVRCTRKYMIVLDYLKQKSTAAGGTES